MAGLTSLASVVAVFPALGCAGVLRTGCRVVCLAPPTPLERHNGVRILWGGCFASGLAHWRVRSGIGGGNSVARGLETKARKRTKKKKSVKEVGEASDSDESHPREVSVDVSDGAESDSGQSPSPEPVTPGSERRTSARGRKKKVLEANDSSFVGERQDTETDKEVSTNGADEEPGHSSPKENARVGSRRRGRSSGKSKTNPNSRPLQGEQVSQTQGDATATVEENRDNDVDVESPVDIETRKKALAAPSVSQSKREKKKKAAAKAPEATTTTNGIVVTAMDVEDSSVDCSAFQHSSTEDVFLSSSLKDEHIHGQELGFAEEPSFTSGFIPVAEADVEPEISTKTSKPRRKREKAAKKVRISGNEELEIRVQETAVSSLNGSVEDGGISGAVSGVDGESTPELGIHNPGVEVKERKQERTKKKPVAVADSDKSVLQNSAAAQSVLLDEAAGSDPQLSSSCEVDEADHQDSHVPEEPEEPPPLRKSARRRRRDAHRQAALQAMSNSEAEGSDADSESGAEMSSRFSLGADIGGALDSPDGDNIWNKSQVDTDGEVSRIRFPAPAWGPKWWEEIQGKSQPTVSFQDIVERKEGFEARAKGFWLFVYPSCLVHVQFFSTLDSSTFGYESSSLSFSIVK